MELTDYKQGPLPRAEEATVVESFRCRCGAVMNEAKLFMDREAGMLFWDAEKEQVEDRAGALLSKFMEALRSKKKRRAWLEDYYGSDDGDGMKDVEVLFEVLFYEEFRSGHTVLKCPDCGRLYVAPNSSDRTWECFRPETKDVR